MFDHRRPETAYTRLRRTAVTAWLTAAVLATMPTANSDAAPGEAPTGGAKTGAVSRLLVGMGDSYSTGGWIPPVDPSSGLCNRSLHAYPLVAADALGVDGRSVACGGAVVADLTAHNTKRGTPPQVAGIGEADIVTLTIGGNDVGGPGGVLESGASADTSAAFAAQVDALRPRLVTGYRDVLAAAPHAQLYVLGYPDIAPGTQQAFDACLGERAAGLDAGAVHANVALLNAAIADAAAAAGAVFVDTTASFAGHEMCAEVAYANAPGDRTPASPGGGMHPNELGHLAMAADLLDTIAAAGPPAAAPPAADPPVVGPPPVPGPPWTAADRAAARAAAAVLRQLITARLPHSERLGAWGAW